MTGFPDASEQWLAIIGFGEDGVSGLNDRARAHLENAEVLVGGVRHFALLDKVGQPDSRPRLTWDQGIPKTLDTISEYQGRAVCVLASGDPTNFGIAKQLIARFGPMACDVIPQAGAFSLLAARMGWAVSDPDVGCVSCHAFPVSTLHRYLAPGARLLVLARDGNTPGEIAGLLEARGFGASLMTVIEHMGGEDERRFDTVATEWEGLNVRDLNCVAVVCRPMPQAQSWSLVPGLPEEAFIHDGKITKREIRAACLARLAPLPGELLWDIGAGSGAVAIEWLRACPSVRAIAIDHDADRWSDIETNAENLGVPHLQLVKGEAPTVLDGLSDAPDAVFVGGGIAKPGVLEAAWARLRPGGRFVANAVTLEAQAVLLAFRESVGGEMTKFAISRSDKVGSMTGMRPLMEVVQVWAIKND